MPFEISPGLIIGLIAFFIGTAVVFAVMARQGGMAFGFKSWSNMSAFLRDPQQRGSRRLFWAGLSAVILGGLVTCGTLVATDATKHRRCRKACEAAGFETGRVRGNPFERPGPRTVYSCWCRNGSDWGPDPVLLPPEPDAGER